MQQIFINEMMTLQQEIILNKEDAHHLKNVLRMKTKDLIRIVDASEQGFIAEIVIDKNEVKAKALELDESKELPVKITLIQGLLKKEKWEYALQKSCELGVYQIVGMESRYSVVKVNKKEKLTRYNVICRQACMQSKRNHLVTIDKVISFSEIKDFKSEYNFIAYEKEDVHHLLTKIPLKASSITIIIGSEGGFSEQEVEYAIQQGFECVSLGKRILRGETAALSALTMIGAKQESGGEL